LRQAVSGVASSRPGNPHSHDQYMAETNKATGDTPIPGPTTKGSTTWDAT